MLTDDPGDDAERNMASPAQADDAPSLTKLLTEAMSRLSKLPAERQDELAQMLIDVAESDRLLESGEVGLTDEQYAEVEAAMSDDEPYASDAEVEEFFAKYRRQGSDTKRSSFGNCERSRITSRETIHRLL